MNKAGNIKLNHMKLKQQQIMPLLDLNMFHVHWTSWYVETLVVLLYVHSGDQHSETLPFHQGSVSKAKQLTSSRT